MPDITPTTPTPPTSPTPSTPRSPVYVIGGGPGGLATAAALGERGVRAVVLEKSDAVAASWRGHYDRLELHTTRRLSALPGYAIPRSYGRWLSRDSMVRYLEQYAEHHRLDVVTGVEVSRIERSGHGHAPASDWASAPDSADSDCIPDSTPGSTPGSASGEASDAGSGTRPGPRWVLRATGGRELTADAVVVATGFNHTPYVPDWPGRDTFDGELLHAGRYRDAAPYRGQDVLVVGTGNTGADIAVDLVEGGASRVRLAVRTPPHIVRRTTLGWPAQATGILVRRLPRRTVDRAAGAAARLSVPDLAPYGLPRPRTGLCSRVLEGATPVQDVGLIDAVRSGRVQPVAAVRSFENGGVLLADGSRITPDVVIAATGYRRGLEDLVGHLDVLDGRGRPRSHGRRPAAPGLYFTGYTNPISGMLRELAIDAGKIAHAVRREEVRLLAERRSRQGRRSRERRRIDGPVSARQP
ncbi:flavin-containing monooxygenase [Streptomyces sp. 8N706]|uniref:flavin-containing monooxygenase n=1 Tax=Streptomyces sp. 8N706 TaxID=3457416 RepID=UPI003FCF2BA6